MAFLCISRAYFFRTIKDIFFSVKRLTKIYFYVTINHILITSIFDGVYFSTGLHKKGW